MWKFESFRPRHEVRRGSARTTKNSRTGNGRHRSLRLEALEDRCLLSITLDLITGSDTGQSSVDNITRLDAPTVVVTYPQLPMTAPTLVPVGPATVYLRGPGAPVPVPIGVVAPGSASAILAPLTLGDGSYSLTATAAVQVGSVAGTAAGIQYQVLSSNTLNIDLDTTVPAIVTPNLLASSDSGTFNTDNVTNVTQPVFDGTGEPNAILRLFADGLAVGQGTVGSDGTWQVATDSLVDGVYNITATQEDLAGNISDASAPLAVTVDTISPNLPFVRLASDTGRNDNDNITRGVMAGGNPTGQVTVNLTVGNDDGLPNNAFPNDLKYRLYDLFEGETLIDTGNLGSVDFFQRTVLLAAGDGVGPGVFLNDGVHPLKLVAEDRAGNLSSEFLLEVVYDTVAPPVSIIGIDPAGTDTGVEGMPWTFHDRITSDTATGFIGRAEADAIVRLYVDQFSDDTISAPNEFSLTVSQPLDGDDALPGGEWRTSFIHDLNNLNYLTFDGLREVLVTAEDLAGNVSTPAGDDILDIFIDTQGPRISYPFGPFGSGGAIQIGGHPEYDLFNPKGSQFIPHANANAALIDLIPSPVNPHAVPTPLVHSLIVNVADMPIRDTGFFYEALAAQGSKFSPNLHPGHFLIQGDHNGIIPIADVRFIPGPPASAMPETGQIVITFFEPLPDDRFTLTISDGITDPAGNRLDGESDAVEPQPRSAPRFPSGDGVPGGDFVARFTVDSRPEIAVWGAGNVWVDTNGNSLFDPDNPDFTNRDIVYSYTQAGFTSDNVFAGKFARVPVYPRYDAIPAPDYLADGFDTIGIYGYVGGKFRWMIDTDNDGVLDFQHTDPRKVNGYPVAGEFETVPDPTNGDEVGLFNGSRWYLDRNHDFEVEPGIRTLITGYPIVGDFDGDGLDDLGTWSDDRFRFDLAFDGLGRDDDADGKADGSIDFGFAGVRERPVAADLDQDGIDDIGLWVPDRPGVMPSKGAEWYFLVSDDLQPFWDDQQTKAAFRPIHLEKRITGQVNTLDHPFEPIPFGKDIFAQYGDDYGVPLVGNFDPPVAGDGGGTPGGIFPTDVTVDFDDHPILSYGGPAQDKDGSVAVEDDGATLRIQGNTWKSIDLNFNVTANTVIEFDFSSSVEGEIHAIGLGKDGDLSKGHTFQLYGTQNWGIGRFNDYDDTAPGVKHYQIPVGQYYTGLANNLFFSNDHDVADPNAESVFSNIRIYEKEPVIADDAVDFGGLEVVSYGGSAQDRSGSATVENGGGALHIQGNSWKAVDFEYDVTADTVLEFDFHSSNQGEIHAIGFDDDLVLSKDRTFQLHGSQNWGSGAFKSYGDASGYKHYQIPVGWFYTGKMNHLFFANDHDVSNPNGEGVFSNVRVYEAADGPAVDFGSFAVSSYGGSQDRSGPAAVEQGGAALHLKGNSWKAIELPYNVTANTMLEFDFSSPSQGEVQGIGFDTDLGLTSANAFQLYGTQNSRGSRDFKDYAADAPGVKHYQIPVGQYYTGQMQHLFFANDHDVSSPDGEGIFANVKLYELAAGLSGSVSASPGSSGGQQRTYTDAAMADLLLAGQYNQSSAFGSFSSSSNRSSSAAIDLLMGGPY